MIPARRFVSPGPDSPLAGVSTPAWQRFVAAHEVQAPDAISDSGGLGMYAMSPRRIVELGYATNFRRANHDKRMVQICDFVLPWTRARFLTDAAAQYSSFARSMMLYHAALMSGDVTKPDECSMAGALTVLHKGGRGALAKWPEMFQSTKALYDEAQGSF